MRLSRSVPVALGVLLVVASAATATDWSPASPVAEIPTGFHAFGLTLHVGPRGVPTASWDQGPDDEFGQVMWAREGRTRWSSPRLVPGDDVGGLYANSHEWTVRFGSRQDTARRGVPGHRFRAPELIGPDANSNYYESVTAGNGTSVFVAVVPRRRRHSGHLFVALRRPGRPFAAERLVWRAPVPVDAFDAGLNARGDGLLVWASRWSVLATRIRHGQIGPVHRVAPTGGRVEWLSTDIAGDGSGVISWLVPSVRRELRVVRFAPPGRSGDFQVIARARRAYPISAAGGVLALATRDGGLLVWEGPARRTSAITRVWALALRNRHAGDRQPLSARGRAGNWVVGNTSHQGTMAVLWRERSSDVRRGHRWNLYAAERRARGWIHRRQLVSARTAVEDYEADLAFNPCTARPMAIWLIPPGSEPRRIVSATGPRVERRQSACR